MSQRNDIEAKLIRKAWEDPSFKKALFENPKAAIEKTLEATIPADMEVVVVEETPKKVYFVIPANPSDVPEIPSLDEKGGIEPESQY